MAERPSRNEEEYFARQEAEILKARREAAEKAAEEAERKSHFMRCPNCGTLLVTEEYHGIEVDRCHACYGIWLDAGDAQALLEQERGAAVGVLESILRGFGG